MSHSQPEDMPEKSYRAILTDRETEILTGEAEVSQEYYYRVVTRVRDKIDRLGDDLETLDEHHETLAGEMRDIVCTEGIENNS